MSQNLKKLRKKTHLYGALILLIKIELFVYVGKSKHHVAIVTAYVSQRSMPEVTQIRI